MSFHCIKEGGRCEFANVAGYCTVTACQRVQTASSLALGIMTNSQHMSEQIKRCPVCGNEPTAVCYTSNPPQYGYYCCGIRGGYNRDWHDAKSAWNAAVDDWNRHAGEEASNE